MATITDRELKAAISKAKRTGKDVWLRDGSKTRGTGREEFRARPTGECIAYLRYTDPSGARERLPVGAYDAAGEAGFTLKELYERAAAYSKLYQSGNRDLRGFLQRQQAEEKARVEAAAKERKEAERQAQAGTLAALLNGYIAHLEAQKKSSARDVRNLFRRNIIEAGPLKHLALMPARDISREDASAILAAMINRGVRRNVAKLRSYARSAYSCAMEASSDPTIHSALHGFSIRANPFAAVPSKNLSKFNRVRERCLTDSEMHAFLKMLQGHPECVAKDAILLCLMLGGQRPAQLLRAKPADVNVDERIVTLYDLKGARQQPRSHALPLTDRAFGIVEQYLKCKDADGKPLPYLFTTNGKVPVRVETIWRTVDTLCTSMTEATPGLPPFSLRDLRRTCETMLARLGVSKDIRAQILSHGLGGVQDRHYDRHQYLAEKRAALGRWDKRLRELTRGPLKGNAATLRVNTAPSASAWIQVAPA